MKEVLDDLLNRFQNQSNYSESKIGVIIAFSSAIIIGVIAVIGSIQESSYSKYLVYYSLAIIILNMFALFFAFSGSYGKTDNKHSSKKTSEEENLYYFKYVSSLHPSQLIEKLKTNYSLSSSNSKLESDIANQIVVLARIAGRKSRFFNISVSFIVASLITPIGLLFFHLYNNPNKWKKKL